MTNLLPHAHQVALTKEYKHRRIVVLLSLFIFVIVVSIGFLLPSYILSTVRLTEIQAQEVGARKINEVLQEDNSASSVTLKEVSEKLLFIKTQGDSSVQAVIDLIILNKPADIKIKSITYQSGDDSNEGTIVLEGLAKDRESLTMFKNMIETQDAFIRVDLPISNFAKDKDINFSMDLFGTF